MAPELPTEHDRVVAEAIRWLTDRERDVCRLLGEGLSNQEIAERLQIQLLQGESPRLQLLTKLGLPDRVHVALSWTRLHR